MTTEMVNELRTKKQGCGRKLEQKRTKANKGQVVKNFE